MFRTHNFVLVKDSLQVTVRYRKLQEGSSRIHTSTAKALKMYCLEIDHLLGKCEGRDTLQDASKSESLSFKDLVFESKDRAAWLDLYVATGELQLPGGKKFISNNVGYLMFHNHIFTHVAETGLTLGTGMAYVYDTRRPSSDRCEAHAMHTALLTHMFTAPRRNEYSCRRKSVLRCTSSARKKRHSIRWTAVYSHRVSERFVLLVRTRGRWRTSISHAFRGR